MAGGYRIFGAEMSPYSVKVRSYSRYKGIPHRWILRNAASQAPDCAAENTVPREGNRSWKYRNTKSP
jgi:hypothetical protein